MGWKVNVKGIQNRFSMIQEQTEKVEWLAKIAETWPSTQASETYPFLGTAMPMQEWVQQRQVDRPQPYTFEIRNVKYQTAIAIAEELMQRENGDVHVDRLLSQLAYRDVTHWAALAVALIEAGETATTWDGQAFFDTDHSSRNSGTQNNDLTSAITAAITPSVQNAADAILDCIESIIGYKDDHGEPMNEDASEFLVLCPKPYWSTFGQAIGNSIIPNTAGTTMLTSPLAAFSGVKVRLQMTSRLSWTTKFAVFRTDGPLKPFIFQEESKLTDKGLKILDINSDHGFYNDEILVGRKAMRAAGYGNWQLSCLYTWTDA